MKVSNSKLLVVVFLVFFLFLCTSRSFRPPRAFRLQVPEGFPQPAGSGNFKLTKEGIALGRALFYDKRLSGRNTISCAGCHKPEKAFADGLVKSKGISGKQLTRHTPVLFNLAWANNGLFWDGGAANLHAQAYGPLTHADEMGSDLRLLEKKLNNIPYYRKQFQYVFHDSVKSMHLVHALAQYQLTLISANSRYDQFVRNKETAYLTVQERRGLALVNQHCRSCHQGALFTDNDFHNNGLDTNFTDDREDGVFQGRYRITFQKEDLGKYKTPSLRNVALSAPYMHDGRFTTLDQVINHYRFGVKCSPTLDFRLMNKQGSPGILMTERDQEAMIAFLKTLTDESLSSKAYPAGLRNVSKLE